MQINKLNLNHSNQYQKYSHHQNIVLSKNGKISLSKSTNVSSQLTAKNKQIHLLKCQVFQLKFKLQKEKAQSRKIAILSDQIKKVKEKLIQKLNEKKVTQMSQLQLQFSQQLSDQVDSQHFPPNLQKQLKLEGNVFNQQERKNEKMKQSTQNIFRNFSLFNSKSIQSRNSQKINDPEMRFIPKRKAPRSDRKNYQTHRIDRIGEEESTPSVKNKKQSMNREKFKKNLGSFFEEKTVKIDHPQQRHNNKPFFYNKFQTDECYEQENNRLQENQKLSIVDFKRRMKK